MPQKYEVTCFPEMYESLASINAKDWRHLWRHLPPLDSMFVPKYALYQSSLKEVIRASITAPDWEYWQGEIATHERLATRDGDNPEDMESPAPLADFLRSTYCTALWLARHDEIQMLTLEGNRIGGEIPLHSFPDGAGLEDEEEISYYEKQEDRDNPYRHLILGQLYARKLNTAGFPCLDLAMNFPETRQRAMYSKSVLLDGIAQREARIIDGEQNYQLSSRHDARAASFLWCYAAFKDNPSDANALGWGDAHLHTLDSMRKDDLAAIYPVLESSIAPKGLTREDIEVLFLNRDNAPPGVKTLDGLRKKDGQDWQETLASIRSLLDPVNVH